MFGDFEKMFNSLLSGSFGLNPDNFTKRSYMTKDGLVSIMHYSNVSDDDDEISLLESELSLAVENQEFEKAVDLRDKIKILKENNSTIKQLNGELSEAVRTQNFELAIELRDKIKDLNTKK
jgi:protein-arginine kinase activator protein McsA